MKIYTKTGDLGETGLWGGQRVLKFHSRIEAYGTVDECNAVLGLVLASNLPPQLGPFLTAIQHRLFVIGGQLASPQPSSHLPVLAESDITLLETWIDELVEQLPPLKTFILPGGTLSASYLHLARTICRRAERKSVELYQTDPVDPLLLTYLNRLSDFLFVAARFANHHAHIADTPWEK